MNSRPAQRVILDEKESPSKDTLKLKAWGLKFPLKTVQVGFVIMLTFFAMVYVSKISGHWQSRVSDQEFRMLLRIIDTPDIVHSSVNMKKSQEKSP